MLGFLYRFPSNTVISIATNVIFFYALTRLFQCLGWNLATFGLLGLGENKLTRKQLEDLPFYYNPAIIPFAWNFIINQTLIIVFANIEVTIIHH